MTIIRQPSLFSIQELFDMKSAKKMMTDFSIETTTAGQNAIRQMLKAKKIRL